MAEDSDRAARVDGERLSRGQDLPQPATGFGGAYAQEVAPERLVQRWRRRLFPTPPIPRRDDDPRTFITTRVVCHVDWLDRLRLLWSGRAPVQVTTYTDVLVNDAESLSTFSVEDCS